MVKDDDEKKRRGEREKTRRLSDSSLMTRVGVVVCEELKISSNPRLQKSPAPKSFAEEEKKKKNKRRACNSDFKFQ